MGDTMKKHVEKFQADYDKIFSKGTWEPKDIEMMKDLQKLMYYIEVRCAMKEGEEYPGSEYMDPGSGANYRHNMNTGRFMPRGGSGTYPMSNGPWYYDDMRGSGRRYYDDEKENAIRRLHSMMDKEDNPQAKQAMQMAINQLEMK